MAEYYAYPYIHQQRPKQRKWLWIPMSFIAGLIGAVLGAYVTFNALSSRPEPAALEVAAPAAVSPVIERRIIDRQTSVADVVAEIGPAVVTVLNLRPVEAQGVSGLVPVGSGSGVILNRSGDQSYIVTNNHVVEGATQLGIVLSNGDELPAELVGVDEFTDLAVLRTDVIVGASAALGNSDNLEPGETVIAIGSPLGTFTNSVTVGVVSALDRSLQADEGFAIENLIQTDAAINQGNSGGPLLNLAGEVVGINTFIVRSGGPGRSNAEGLGFAVPASTVKVVADQIIERGYVSYPFIGIRSSWITPPIAEANDLPVPYGVLVRSVAPDGPADAAGIEAGDILTGINENDFEADRPFINQLFEYQPGDTVQIDLLREFEPRRVQVELAERPER
jgi:2-alkenal reductase